MKYFVIDVESIGLHGEPYAVGWVVLDEEFQEVEYGKIAIDPLLAHGDADDREWCRENIPPITVTHISMQAMLVDFWSVWMKWKKDGAVMFGECIWPVESKFVVMCLHSNYPKSKWDGPYPFHDISSMMLSAGMDPLATYARKENELPRHDPLADARQSARLLKEVLTTQHD